MSNRRRIPHTRTHQTGSGGLHILFKHNELARTGNGRLGEGIDVKATGGYIVWWPAFGRKIACEGPISEWPDWLIAKQQPRPPRDFFPRTPGSKNNLDPVAKFVASLVEGNRNNGTFWGFCRAFEAVAEGARERVGSGAHNHTSGAQHRARRTRSTRDCTRRQVKGEGINGIERTPMSCWPDGTMTLDEINEEQPRGPRLMNSARSSPDLPRRII